MPTIEEAIAHEIKEGNVMADTINSQVCIYPVSLYQAEVNSAAHLKRLLHGEPPWGHIDYEKAIPCG